VVFVINLIDLGDEAEFARLLISTQAEKHDAQLEIQTELSSHFQNTPPIGIICFFGPELTYDTTFHTQVGFAKFASKRIRE